MAREPHESTRRSEEQSAVRTDGAQAGCRVQRSGPETGTRRRAGDHLSQQRGGAGHSQSFQQRNAANGQPYDMNAMTAAHRTLPLNTIARVTDLKTGDSVLLRITDRGPFVSDRVIDLSRAAARRLSVYQHGTALVKIEVLETPASIKEGGRWCVQIGAFQDSDDARKLKEKLARRYRTAKVLQFSSPVGGDWIRVRVAEDDKKRAQEVMRETHTEATMFLVRLD